MQEVIGHLDGAAPKFFFNKKNTYIMLVCSLLMQYPTLGIDIFMDSKCSCVRICFHKFCLLSAPFLAHNVDVVAIV